MPQNSDKNIIVSVVMPVYNEEKYIENCILSLLKQDYPQTQMEWIFVDGDSKDNTKEIIEGFRERYPDLIRLYNNPQRAVPYAMNIGIKKAVGKYIIRLDAHSEYEKDYISKCVYYLDNTDAHNVGGVATTKSRGFVGNTIAKLLASKFGVGNSRFRVGGQSGYVDTVPFGAFRREVFTEFGLYDERLTRNQDNEMNYRIRKNGGKVYLASDIKFSYYCRDNVKDLVKMALSNGKWNIITMKLCPGSMGLRHFIPFLFLLSLIILPLLGIFFPLIGKLFLCELGLYFLLSLIFAFKEADQLKQVPLLFILFPIFHLSYGLGSLGGLVAVLKDY
ncbi:MAG: glycosyltransferase family 2 protein [Desulfitobacteriia bacterium]|jgi:glycosyltransferase involved in cell wall biosynthesis